jgi:hypothetical protein
MWGVGWCLYVPVHLHSACLCVGRVHICMHTYNTSISSKTHTTLTHPPTTPNPFSCTKQYKKEYEVRLSGFPRHSVVLVRALRLPPEGDEEDGAGREEDGWLVARPMVTVTTDAQGRAVVRGCWWCLFVFVGG